jgi:hypothetical protein
MFRMIRRAPWIALGAAGVYYLDATSGPARRSAAGAWTRTLVERGRDRWQGTLAAPSPADDGLIVVVDAPLMASVSHERVRTRADGPQAEESAAGVPAPALDAMAKTILEDSEHRVTDRVGTSDERRRSEDTVEPLPT